MNKQQILATLKNVLSCPTAPFHEDAVAKLITTRLGRLRQVKVRRDGFGNLIAEYRGSRARARYAFAAHMDHPGWLRESDGKWQFLGGVPEVYRKEPKIAEFGAFGMWDLPAFQIRDGRIYARACDDLVGCAALVSMLEELSRTEENCSVLALFTRAEEVGFIGAMKLAEAGEIDRIPTIISVETSAERPPAKMGEGPIIRVGDRTSVFDSAATAALTEIATTAKIPHQRCLMSGGTCEATAFQLYGYRTTGLTIALGNYHNCGPDEQIAPEFVSVDDVCNLARLCIQIAHSREDPAAVPVRLKKKLEKNLRKHRPHFRDLDATG